MDKNLQQQLYGGMSRSAFSSSTGTRQSSVSSYSGGRLSMGGGGGAGVNKTMHGGMFKKQTTTGLGSG